MVREDETALICDLAETYGILDWRALPLATAAALSAGLRENSRIRMKLSGMQATREELLLAAAVDRLSMLVWSKTKDAEHNRNRPESIFEKLAARPEDEKEEEKATAFRDGASFDAAWKEAVGSIKEV